MFGVRKSLQNCSEEFSEKDFRKICCRGRLPEKIAWSQHVVLSGTTEPLWMASAFCSSNLSMNLPCITFTCSWPQEVLALNIWPQSSGHFLKTTVASVSLFRKGLTSSSGRFHISPPKRFMNLSWAHVREDTHIHRATGPMLGSLMNATIHSCITVGSMQCSSSRTLQSRLPNSISRGLTNPSLWRMHCCIMTWRGSTRRTHGEQCAHRPFLERLLVTSGNCTHEGKNL